MMHYLFAHDQQSIKNIPGLSYVPDYISVDEERSLIAQIDKQNWIADLKRRVQHYGYKYDYKARGISDDAYLGPLPEWLNSLTTKLYDEKIFTKLPDQVIVNEYLPGQGISAHIDCAACFGDIIASLSVGSATIMQFKNLKSGVKTERLLEQRSLVVLSTEARYDWTHEIPARKTDKVDGYKIERKRRVSLTFRNVIHNQNSFR
jgi:alkylated DNA repair dioxygenase AlkB